MALDTIFKSYNLESTDQQNYSAENLFLLRHKTISLVHRLSELGLIRDDFIVNWCIDKILSSKDMAEGDLLDLAQTQLLFMTLHKVS